MEVRELRRELSRKQRKGRAGRKSGKGAIEDVFSCTGLWAAVRHIFQGTPGDSAEFAGESPCLRGEGAGLAPALG